MKRNTITNTDGDLPVCRAAHIFFANLFRLSDDGKTSNLLHCSLRMRKRCAVLLHSGELATEFFYYGAPPQSDLLALTLARTVLPADEGDHARLREIAWRLVTKHYRTILELALELSRVRKLSEKRLAKFLPTVVSTNPNVDRTN